MTNFDGLYQGGAVTALEQAFNENMNSVRSRAEHAVAEHVEGKQMLHGTYPRLFGYKKAAKRIF